MGLPAAKTQAKQNLIIYSKHNMKQKSRGFFLRGGGLAGLIFICLSSAACAGFGPLKNPPPSEEKPPSDRQEPREPQGNRPAAGCPKIRSKHWHGAAPCLKAGSPPLLLIHDIFAIAFDQRTRFPKWTAYHLDPPLVWGKLKERRDYTRDPLLPPGAGLSRQDYKGASRFLYDRGHFAPAGSFKGSRFAYQAQYLSNIVPQKRNLNQGPWRLLEESIRAFANQGHELKILAGPLYGSPSPGGGAGFGKSLAPWPELQGKTEQLPSGFWKMAAFKKKGRIRVCSFIMPQEVKSRSDRPKNHIVPRSKITKHTGLAFFEGAGAPIRDDCGFLPLK